jgi:hypothetical protein
MMRKTLVATLVLGLLVMAGTALGGPKKVNPAPPAKQSFLEAFQQLSKTAALDEASIKASLDVYLTADKEKSNQFFAFFAGKPRGGSLFEKAISAVDFRAPQQGAKGPFLYVELKAAAALPVTDLEQRFGKPDEVQAQPPPNPITVIYVYKSALGPVRFGLSSDQKQVLTATIDRTE